MSDENFNVPQFIRRLMPDASDVELREATETFIQYMAVVRRIYERLTQKSGQSDSQDSGLQGRFGNANHIL